jgi:membrane associated rhomboid family serine protease
MFIPISTDAPVYYWPWATLSLIVGNTAVFALNAAGVLPGGGELWPAWSMHFGNGFHPGEWVTCHFVHFGILHLLGNMLFLWVFGLVVEGKLGWWRYLLVYFGIGIVQASLLQLLMMGSTDPRPVGGASGIIYGLMAIALVWAPKNEVTIFSLVWYRFFVFEMSILALAGFYIAMQVAFAALTSFEMSSEILHLFGAAVGFGVGVFLLQRQWVDCENWDLFAVLRGTYGSTAISKEIYYRDEVLEAQLRQRVAGSPDEPLRHIDLPDPSEAGVALERMRYCLDRRKPSMALTEYRSVLACDADHNFERADLSRLIDALSKARLWDEVAPLLEEFVTTYPDDARMRLNLAALHLEIETRPRQALRVLEGMSDDSLEGRFSRQFRRLESKARHLIESGVLELQG